MTPSLTQLESRWPHRWAVLLVCATFPLIWVGGLVTTYGAGMAVPDWPNTYGYNLFLYPWQTWVYGPFKLFIEHGHRLFGSLVGMITIGFLVSTFWCQKRTMPRVLGFIALAAVIFQGLLGGARVIQDEVQLAKIHGCFGPAFFAFTVVLAVVTSAAWRREIAVHSPALSAIQRLSVLTTLLAYGQLVLGSQLRHLPANGQPGDFRLALYFHLITAAVLALHVALLSTHVIRARRALPWLVRPGVALLALLGLQLVLGAGTWVAKYNWPAWMGDYAFAAGHVVAAESSHQVWMTTAHVATGSLILATSMLVTMRAARLSWHHTHHNVSASWQMEAVR